MNTKIKKIDNLTLEIPKDLNAYHSQYQIKVSNNGNEKLEIKLSLKPFTNVNINDSWYSIEPNSQEIQGHGHFVEFVLNLIEPPINNQSTEASEEIVTLVMITNPGEKETGLSAYNLIIPPATPEKPAISLVLVAEEVKTNSLRLTQLENISLRQISELEKQLQQQQEKNNHLERQLIEFRQDILVLEDNLTNTRRELQESQIQQDANLETQIQRFNTLIDKLKGPNGETLRFACGSTEPGKTQWVQYPHDPKGIYVDIDISSAGFSEKPFYFTSIEGISGHWNTTGATSIYPSDNGKGWNESFTIYLHFSEGPITPTQANEWGWHIQWLAVGI